MTAPSVTLKTLQNEDTGIDISVPAIQEEEAPLGGISVLYEICVLTKLELYKTRLHSVEDIVQFSVYKAYREVEDFHNKLNKKFPASNLPSIPKLSNLDKYCKEDRIASLNSFMQAVSQNLELCQSSLFRHFIGIDSQKSCAALSISSKSVPPKESDDLSDVFPKVKNTAVKAGGLQTPSTDTKDMDLFDEVKTVKQIEENKKTSGGLFDDFEDDSLFSTTPVPKTTSAKKKVDEVPKVVPKKKEPEKKEDTGPIDDSQIIIKDRKLGDISLFDEQDLGEYITKEEESLFLVTPDSEKSSKNILLFSSFDSADSDSEIQTENLDDLMNMNPLPMSPSLTSPDLLKSPESDLKTEEKLEELIKDDELPKVLAVTEQLPKRPVPLPRKKSLGKSDTDEPIGKPEVMPRKVFLQKPEVPTKPTSISTQDTAKPTKPPPISAKPAVLPKPKPPIKGPKPTIHKETKDLDTVNANPTKTVAGNQNTMSNLGGDLDQLDILKYIEQEQKMLDAEPSLFD